MLRLPYHKTKIVCTIGPACRSESVLKKLILNGMNVARLNFSHGTLEEHKAIIKTIRSLADALDRNVLILIDLPGPKIRIGTLQHEPLVLKKGSLVTLTTKPVIGTDWQIPVDYSKLPKSVFRGSLIYLNDGFVQLKVQSVFGSEVRCKVIIGGELLSKKGINLPEAKIPFKTITQSDLDFIDFGLNQGVHSFCLSFVEKAADILKVKEFAKKRNTSIKVIAKIERAEALSNIDEIITAADCIMVARGDLGVQIPIEDIPIVQKKIIQKANLANRPVITATQMLESMTQNIRPTRAEVTDVANAILDGSDALMLSEETAIGSYPVNALKIMTKIAHVTEKQRWEFKITSDSTNYFKRRAEHQNISTEDVVSLEVSESISSLKARLIATPTSTGNTSRRIARFKPDCWIIAFCNNRLTRDFLNLSYSVYPVLIKNFDNWYNQVMTFIRNQNLAKKGDKIILTEGLSPGIPGGTNSMKIITLE
jgi:pyruvate kinase